MGMKFREKDSVRNVYLTKIADQHTFVNEFD